MRLRSTTDSAHNKSLLASKYLIILMMALLAGRASSQSPDTASKTTSPNFRVRLLSPLTTKFTRKGDIVSARVVEPAQYEGNILEGQVHEIKDGGTLGKTSSVQFDFHTLHVADKTLSVAANLVQVANSSRQADQDEEGVALESTSRGGAGKLVSGVFSRGSGTPLRLSAKAHDLSLLPGSEFVLEVRFQKVR